MNTKRYDPKFKLKVAKEAARTSTSVKAIARGHGLDFSTLRRWVATYRQHGEDGFHLKARRYDLKFKLSVLEKARQDGMSNREATTYFQIGAAGAVAEWKRLYAQGGPQALIPPDEVSPRKPMKKPSKPKRDEDLSRDELLKEVAYLRAETAYLKKLDALIQEEQAAQRGEKRKPSKG